MPIQLFLPIPSVTPCCTLFLWKHH